MKELTENPLFADQWDVYINLSADTMPVYTPQVLANLFDPNINISSGRGLLHDINFVTSHSCTTGLVPTSIHTFPSSWHKRAHYESHGDFDISYIDEHGNHRTDKLVIHFGSQWMILTPAFVQYIASSLQRENSLPSMFKNELLERATLMPDETFIPTLLSHHSKFSQTLPRLDEGGTLVVGPQSMKIKSIRYERMDENRPDAFGNVVDEQRYDVPDSSTEVDTPKSWGPYFLGVYGE